MEKEHKMHANGEVDLVNAMKILRERDAELEATKLALKELTEVALPIADIVEPPIEGVEPRPLAEILKIVPAKIIGYIQKKSFYPQGDLALVAEVIAQDCCDEQFQ